MYRSLIRSDERLDYERSTGSSPAPSAAAEPWGAPLAAARAAAAALGELRSERSALVVDSAEPSFVFDRAGDVVDVELSVQTESHRLIEALMVAANEQVARVLAEHERPGAVPRPRAARAGGGGAAGRAARLARGADAAGAGR